MNLFSAVDSLTHKTKLLDFELIWSSVEYIVLCTMRTGKRARAVKSSVPGLPDGVAGLKFSFC